MGLTLPLDKTHFLLLLHWTLHFLLIKRSDISSYVKKIRHKDSDSTNLPSGPLVQS